MVAILQPCAALCNKPSDSMKVSTWKPLLLAMWMAGSCFSSGRSPPGRLGVPSCEVLVPPKWYATSDSAVRLLREAELGVTDPAQQRVLDSAVEPLRSGNEPSAASAARK